MLPSMLKSKILLSVSLESGLFAFSAAPVARYFMDLLGSQYPQTCNSILGFQGVCYVVLAAIANATVGCDLIKKRFDFLAWYKRNFGTIILIDSIIFTSISLLSEDCVILRFVGMAVLTTITGCLWKTVSFSQISNLLSGDELTIWQTKAGMYEQFSAFLGNLTTIIIGDITSIHSFIFIQCFAVWVTALVDYSAFQEAEKILKNN